MVLFRALIQIRRFPAVRTSSRRNINISLPFEDGERALHRGFADGAFCGDGSVRRETALVFALVFTKAMIYELLRSG